MKSLKVFLGAICFIAVCTGCVRNPLGPDTASAFQPTAIVPTATAVTSVTTTAGTTPTVPTATATATVVATATPTAVTNTYYVVITGTMASNFNAWVGKKLLTDSSPVTQVTYTLDGPSFVWTSTNVVDDPATEFFHMEGVCTAQNVNIKVYKNSVLLANWSTSAPGNPFSTND